MWKTFFLIPVTLLLGACLAGGGSIDGKSLQNAGQSAPGLEDDAPEKLNILVFGGTSGIGLETVKLGLARGHNITSIARRPERMPIENDKLTNLKGDITDISTFLEVVEGKHAIISAIGLSPSRKTITVYSDGIKQVHEAMEKKGVSRLVSVTGIGAGDSRGHGGFFHDKIMLPYVLGEDYADKTRQEEVIRKTVFDWTIVRPGFLHDKDAATTYRVLENLEGVEAGGIARADVAHFLISIVESNFYKHKTVLLSD